MMVFRVEEGLCFWPEELVSAVTPAFPDRMRVVTSDGTVGYCPSGRKPFVRDRLDAAGFYHADVELAETPAYAPEPYWGLEACDQGLRWHGDEGPVVCDLPLAQAAKGMCPFARGWYFHPRRLRLLSEDELVLDQGTRFRLTEVWRPRVWEFMGISASDLQPDSLTRVFLREYPFDIVRASEATLRQYFSSAAALIVNIIWQALLYRRLGQEMYYGKTHRGFWYNPLHATLERGGFLDHRLSKEAAERLYHDLLARMVDDDRLFQFGDLGFEDVFGSEREIGSRPDVILMIEKKDLSPTGIRAARNFGLSWIVTGGVSRIVVAEFFAAALRAVYRGSVRILVYGDFDPGGRVAGHSLVDHLARFAVECPAGPEFLVDPSAFSEEELELFSRPLSVADGRVEEFVAETGGIHGQARGVHADWLTPPDRLIELLAARLDSGV